jgi:hypothetical protein
MYYYPGAVNLLLAWAGTDCHAIGHFLLTNLQPHCRNTLYLRSFMAVNIKQSYLEPDDVDLA